MIRTLAPRVPFPTEFTPPTHIRPRLQHGRGSNSIFPVLLSHLLRLRRDRPGRFVDVPCRPCVPFHGTLFFFVLFLNLYYRVSYVVRPSSVLNSDTVPEDLFFLGSSGKPTACFVSLTPFCCFFTVTLTISLHTQSRNLPPERQSPFFSSLRQHPRVPPLSTSRLHHAPMPFA